MEQTYVPFVPAVNAVEAVHEVRGDASNANQISQKVVKNEVQPQVVKNKDLEPVPFHLAVAGYVRTPGGYMKPLRPINPSPGPATSSTSPPKPPDMAKLRLPHFPTWRDEPAEEPILPSTPSLWKDPITGKVLYAVKRCQRTGITYVHPVSP